MKSRPAPEAWQEDGAGGLRRRYRSYEAYAEHQASKLSVMNDVKLAAHHVRLRSALMDGLKGELEQHLVGKTVLCLGARTGAEVEAFIALGCFAIGVDLNPGSLNRFVVAGDFHRLVFGAATVGVVYTNALDHVWHLGDVLNEALRVLRPSGILIVDAILGVDEGKRPGPWESFSWSTTDGLFARIERAGFQRSSVAPLDSPPYPWPGARAVMVRP